MTTIKPYPVVDSGASFSNEYAPIIKQILHARSVLSDADLDQSLAALEDPASMKGIDAGTELLEAALAAQRQILICGDYDADGATSTALLVRVLRQMGIENIDFLVPNRFDFGYGLSSELVDVAIGLNPKPDLIITVDNGISSISGIAHARANGIEVLVTDHHLPGAELPDANVIINPNQPGCAFPSKNLAGVGVVFYLLIALRARLRASGWFQKQGISEPRLEQYLDIVALGSVADLVSLDKLNRIFVTQGLKLIRSGRGNPGIRSLFAVSGRDIGNATSMDLGFAIGPRINAAGRLDDITQGILCLLQDDAHSAHEFALEMHQINQDRRQIQDQMILEAENALDALEFGKDSLESAPWGYCCYQQDWHQGLVGLVASRIKEQMHRPVIAFAKSEQTNMAGEAELKGSGRSIAGLHIRDCLELVASQNPGLIKKFGGHAMAAGLSLDEASYGPFAKAFDKVVRSMLKAEDLQSITWVDGSLDDSGLSMEFAKTLENLLPWGQGVPEPQFVGEFEVVHLRWLKETHLKLRLAQQGCMQIVDAIWFNAPLDVIEKNGDRFRAVYRLGINRYMGKESLQLMLTTGEVI